MFLIGLIGWLLAGLLIGFIVSKVLDLHGDDPRLGIAVAAAGAVVAATLYTLISGAGVSAFNVWSLIWATLGAAAATGIWHTVRGRYVSRTPYTRRSSY
jgi:uncharacterized membrane protein YeaQ/YmgE (transglycosylase-associated protein family)